MKNKFLNVCLGLSAILLSSALFVRSFSTAKAEELPAPQHFMAEGGNKTGKYQMMMSRVAYNDGTSNVRIMVWDTETGRSVYWRINPEDNGWTKMGDQLPSNPME